MATINVQEFAEVLDTTPRTARKFLRSVTPVEKQPGKGSRWQIEKKQVRSLKAQFTKFLEEHTRPVNEADTPETDDELEALIDNA